jgi:peptidyl-prolyl cis-trans isomerase B (cyclophilin B)
MAERNKTFSLKVAALALLCGLLALGLSGCNDEVEFKGQGLPYTPTPPEPNPTASIQTDFGEISLELFEGEAPNTVANFITLAEQKFYDGLTFHRIVKDFMIQGGDPKGNGSGGPGYKFRDEIHGNPHKNVHYALSMANSGPNTNGSQFFIVTNPKGEKNLDTKHTVFGKVTKGFETVDKIAAVEVKGETPKEPVKILSIKILSKRSHKYEVAGKIPDPPKIGPQIKTPTIQTHPTSAQPNKAEENKPVNAKPAETKPVEAKPAVTKPAESKPAEAKPAAGTPASAPEKDKPVEKKAD